ncbi:LacI family DNA-binding transcriptional regulator [Arthrospiribacter ruber]|uniref:LacI family transcriptional regulator n=1 Tax=Arthrospiribacter ruber TaxID=2487934 RepID=A0A951J024_9BACT|nr:LacI family DNA-binding transcriptional regulator [Arthrospiribacter ruber]MBW3469514.1 LacI family transcriptional regulator [Arthrospiribacter ruber]
MKKNQVTITDIAKELNVSPSTVSRALHDSPFISEERKREILDFAKKMNYRPNQLALSLLNKRTKILGVIVPEITSYYFSTAINGIQDKVGDFGYKLMISQSNESFEEEIRLMEAMSLVRVDGFLISPSSNTVDFDHIKTIKESGFPLIIFDRDCHGLDVDKVVVDDYSGAFDAVNYLVKTGCKRIAHITGSSNLSTTKHRRQGYLDALLENGLNIQDELIIFGEDSTSETGVDGMKSLFNLEKLPDAVFCYNDAIAIGAMSVIRERDILIPDQISLVGFDDEPYSTYFKPSLTSVWQPVYDLGVLSAKILLDQLNSDIDQNEYRHEILKPELVIRNSSKQL